MQLVFPCPLIPPFRLTPSPAAPPCPSPPRPAAPPFAAEKSHTGFIQATTRIGDNTGVGVIYFIGAAFWTLESLWSLWVYKLVYRCFRGQGMSAAQVKRDAATRAAASQV